MELREFSTSSSLPRELFLKFVRLACANSETSSPALGFTLSMAEITRQSDSRLRSRVFRQINSGSSMTLKFRAWRISTSRAGSVSSFV